MNGNPLVVSEGHRAPPLTIHLWRRRVHLLTANLVLDICERRLRPHQTVDDLVHVYAFAVIATDENDSILATALNRRFPSEAAVTSLDRAVEALARRSQIRRTEYWKLTFDRVVVVTQRISPFSSARFQRAVEELGCTHRFS